MGWAIGMLNLKTGMIELYAGQKITKDDPEYGPDVHIIPINPISGSGADLSFGAHEFTRQCYCHPTTRPATPHKTFVFHKNTVN
jgi:hypothetical protein